MAPSRASNSWQKSRSIILLARSTRWFFYSTGCHLPLRASSSLCICLRVSRPMDDVRKRPVAFLAMRAMLLFLRESDNYSGGVGNVTSNATLQKSFLFFGTRDNSSVSFFRVIRCENFRTSRLLFRLPTNDRVSGIVDSPFSLSFYPSNTRDSLTRLQTTFL